MDDLKNLDLGNLSSMDDLDLAMMGFLPTPEEKPQEDGKPTIAPSTTWTASNSICGWRRKRTRKPPAVWP